MAIALPVDVTKVVSTAPGTLVTGLSAAEVRGTTYYLLEVDFQEEGARPIVATTPGKPPTVAAVYRVLVSSGPGTLPPSVQSTFAEQFPTIMGPSRDLQLEAAERQISNGMVPYRNLPSQRKLFSQTAPFLRRVLGHANGKNS